MSPNTPRDRDAPCPSAPSAVDREPGGPRTAGLAPARAGPPGQALSRAGRPAVRPDPLSARHAPADGRRDPRESFDFKGTGHYTIGPGGFSDQSITIHGYGKPGTSNLSRRFHFQFLINEPSSSAPSQVVSGNINFVAGNYLQNGADLILDFVGPDGHRGQRPAHAPLLGPGRQPGQLRAVRGDGLGLPGATATSRRTTSTPRASRSARSARALPPIERQQLGPGPRRRHVQVRPRCPSPEGQPRLRYGRRRHARPLELFRRPEPGGQEHQLIRLNAG